MSAFVWFVFSSGGVLLVLLCGVVWLWFRPKSVWARRYLLFFTIAYTLASTYGVEYLIGEILVWNLRPFAASDVPAGRTAIIIMGSGSYTVRDWENHEYSMPDPQAAGRVLEAVRVYKLVDPAVVISSGGKAYDEDPRVPTSIVMRRALLDLGVPDTRIVLQTKSRNTYEEAIDNSRLCSTLQIDHLIVVTSDFHMKRTIGAFRAAGVNAVPAPARESFEPLARYEWWVPSELGLLKASTNVHEFLGLGYYAVRGWFAF